ncbi:hypothetical protein ACX0G9_26330 [Flavitalea flava]
MDLKKRAKQISPDKKRIAVTMGFVLRYLNELIFPGTVPSGYHPFPKQMPKGGKTGMGEPGFRTGLAFKPLSL